MFKSGRSLAGACGLVGYPNVGKSTVFNAMAGSALAAAANYPFCTIEPNICRVPIPDAKLSALGAKFETERVIPASIEMRDIAGLIKGASKGEGMGNAFLSHIRSGASVIVQVLRCFESADVLSVCKSIDPMKELIDIQEELILADLELLTRKVAKRGPSLTAQQDGLLSEIFARLENGQRARGALVSASEVLKMSDFFKELEQILITSKPLVLVGNVESVENVLFRKLQYFVSTRNFDLFANEISPPLLPFAAFVEAEAASLTDKDFATEFLISMTGNTDGLPNLMNACRHALGLGVYYTVGKVETRAWLFKKDACAPEAAKAIHSDFEHKMISVTVDKVDDLLHGRKRPILRGRDYQVIDGHDVLEFKIKGS